MFSWILRKDFSVSPVVLHGGSDGSTTDFSSEIESAPIDLKFGVRVKGHIKS